MAEQIIGLKIELNGLNTVITDIKTLEEELRKAKEDLKDIGLNFGTGSEGFKKLKTEIIQAESQLTKLNKSVETVSPERQIEGFSKLGAGISSSFAAATAAVSLFGKESDAVQQAATQAQNLLTIALSVRGLAEVRTGAQIVARTISEKALAASTNSLNNVTKSFYATLAANPYAAIIASVGVLIGLFVALSEEETNAATELEKLTLIIDKFTQSVSNSNAEIGRRAELAVATAELEGKSIEEITKIRKDALDEQLFNIAQELDVFTKSYETRRKEALRVAKAEKKDLIQAEAQFELDFQKKKDDFNNQLYEGEKQYQLLDINLRKQQKTEREKLEQQEYQNSLKILKNRLDAQNAIVESLSKYNEGDAEVSAEVLDRAKKLQEELKVVYQAQLDVFNDVQNEGKKLQKETEDLLFPNVPTPAQLKSLQDDYIKAFEKLGSNIKKSLIPLNKNVVFDVKEIEEQLGVSLSSLTPEAQKALVQFYERLRVTAKTYGGGIKIADVLVGTPKDQKDAAKSLIKLTEQTVEILNDPTILKGLKETEIRKVIQTLFDLPTKTLNDFTGTIEQQQIKLEEYNNGLKVVTQNLIDYSLVQAEQVIQTNKVKDALAKETEEVLKLSMAVGNINQLPKNLGDIADLTPFRFSQQFIDNYVKQVTEKLKKEPELLETYFKEVSLRSNEFLIRFGEDGLRQLFQNISTGVIGVKDITKEQIDELLKLLKAASDTVTTEYGPELGKAFEPAIKKLETDGKKLQKAISLSGLTETVKEAADIVQQFSQLIGQIGSLVAQSFDIQLQQLEKDNARALEQVVGDTQQANQKRIELEKQYQLKKADIEKRALIRSLQFQKVQAIADVAQAVANNLEIPVLAIAIGILGAIQIALIQDQINQAQSLAGGGKIRMGAGGMVVGPSHEMGGVSYAGGVNLEGGESVINRQSSLNYAGLLSQINQSGGGQPIVNNASNSLMEERLVQAISKANQEPIRAYVLNSEITNGQAINRRLNELATI